MRRVALAIAPAAVIAAVILALVVIVGMAALGTPAGF